MKITLEDIKNIKIRRKPTFNDILRIFLGICIIIFGIVCATGVIPDTKKSAPFGLIPFGCLFIFWGFYPLCSKHERSTSQVLDAFDRMRIMPETPGQLKKVHVPGTEIRVGDRKNYTKEELKEHYANINRTAGMMLRPEEPKPVAEAPEQIETVKED